MTARVLSFTNEVREAAKDARSLRIKLRDEGHEWTPALAAANAKMVELALNPGEEKPTTESRATTKTR